MQKQFRPIKPGSRTEKAYKYIVQYKLDHDGNAPTIREIGDYLDIRSTSLVAFYLDRLEQVGYIRRVGERRVIALAGGHYEFIGEEPFRRRQNESIGSND